MKKRIRFLACFLACILLIMGFLGPVLQVSAETEYYTYNYDWWGEVQESPDAYEVAGVYASAALGLDKGMSSPQGMFVYEDLIYICDTGNNRIIELERTGKAELQLVRVIESFNGAENNTFSGPMDIFRSADDHLYIADKQNGRIVKITTDLEYVQEFIKPTDSTFDQSLNFLPDKIAVDTAGRVYCVAQNINKGLIKYESDGTFSGFIGATKVIFDWTQYIWKRIATKEQRAQMESFVPTEYDNLYMDYEGFIYVCTTSVDESQLLGGGADPIRRLNMMGEDILVRNGNWEIVGDLYWGSGGGYSGSSLMADITAMENDVFVGLDKVRGRLFAYDDQGRMLFAFGGNGNVDGYFRQPTAIDHQGRDLLVLDALDNSITLFTPTEFGTLIYDAIEQFQKGEYEASGDSWQQVMDRNGNYDLAYIGVGRSLMRQKQYKEAMEYFELKWDDENYSKAFKQYRKEWVEENIVWIFSAVILLLVLPLAIGKIRAIKKEIDTADIFRR